MTRYGLSVPVMQACVVDTFIDADYAGNPAGVVLLDSGFLPQDSMQEMARSLALPTTGFVVSAGAGNNFHLRWFTPESPLMLCGHATIASAAVLFELTKLPPASELRFSTPSGPLYAQQSRDCFSVDLPAMGIEFTPPPPGLEDALGARIVRFAKAVDDYVAWVESAEIVRQLQPNFNKLRSSPCRGHIVTAPGDHAAIDFVSRSFFPALGVNEDQVCVSAHCKLGPYWGQTLGKTRMSAVQLSPSGGRLSLELAADRVRVGGSAKLREVISVGSE